MIHTETSDRTGQPAPHQLASEMTPDVSVQAIDAQPDTRRPVSRETDGHVLPRVERKVGGWIAAMILGAIVLGLVISAVLFQQLTLLAIGAVFIIPFLLLVSAPVWLASATKKAQDETVHEQQEAANAAR